MSLLVLYSERGFFPGKSFIDQLFSVKMAGHWPRSLFACLRSSTSSRSINTQKKKNLANIQPSWPHTWSITHIYYMTSSVSGQDEPNRALWLATRAGKMERYCPLGISRLVPQDQRSFFGVLSHIINPLLTKIVRSRWLDIGLVLFLRANIQSSWPHAWSITHTYQAHNTTTAPLSFLAVSNFTELGELFDELALEEKAPLGPLSSGPLCTIAWESSHFSARWGA